MSKDCKQRFKGVENFLRRVAFNLGNTPSQTEVKIISCIPIDVTDLQQKIIELEKQLESASHRRASIVQAAICNIPSNPNAEISRHRSSDSVHNQCCTDKPKSNISFLFPTESSPGLDCQRLSTDLSNMTNEDNCKPMEFRKNFFMKRKKFPKRKKVKTQLVYYAKNEDKNPFNYYGLPDDGTSKNRGKEESNNFHKSYLTDMIRRQYMPEPVNEITNASEFSTPICRDVSPVLKIPEAPPYESDMCSCCHGPFKNIDNHTSKQNHFDIFSPHMDSSNAYYDSNLYDVVPVKEHAVKIKNIDIPKRKDLKNEVQIASCWPEQIRPRYKIPPMNVNYHISVPKQQHITKKTLPVKLNNRKEIVVNKMAKLKPQINAQISSIEFGEIYAKRLKKTKHNILKLTPKKVKKLNDAACLTNLTVNTECQTASVSNANAQQNKTEEDAKATAATEDKTEVTLNQIKSILQSVLAEVKTNSKLSNTPEKARKDAVVQNGPSQSNICGGSSLLQSYTYSPYNMSPYSGASCSRQMPPSNFCYPNPTVSTKCLPHYPLLVQLGRNVCTNCNKNTPKVNKMPIVKHAASAGTNTDDLRVRSQETEKLIKEIYKSIALQDEVSKKIPMAEHGDINETIRRYGSKAEDKEEKHIAKAISEIFKNTKPFDSSETEPLESKLTSNETSFRSHQTARDCSRSTRKQTAAYYSNAIMSETVDNEETEQVSQELESDEDSDETIVNENEDEDEDEDDDDENEDEDKDESESELSVSETESDDVVVAVEEPIEKKEKGLFSKMLKMLKPRRKKDAKVAKVAKGTKKTQSSESDSDDYQTVYSDKVSTPKLSQKTIKSKAHSKVYSKQPQQKLRSQSPGRSTSRRSPYMEQEYRRYFDEKLTFHDNHNQRQRYSSTRGTPREKPVYYQKVEARRAMVSPYARPRVDGTRQNYQPNIRQAIHQQNYQPNIRQAVHQQNYQPNMRQANHQNVQSKRDTPKASIVGPKAMAWLNNHRLGIRCGEQWKKLILEG